MALSDPGSIAFDFSVADGGCDIRPPSTYSPRGTCAGETGGWPGGEEFYTRARIKNTECAEEDVTVA